MSTLTASPWAALVTHRSRISFRYTPSGRHAASLAGDARGSIYCEFWRLTGPEPGCSVLPGYRLTASGLPAGRVPYEAVPFDDGSALVLATDVLTLVEPSGATTEVPAPPVAPGVIAPSPDGTRRLLLIGRGDEGCPVWLWSADEGLRPLGDLPVLTLRSGGWADLTAERFVVNPVAAGRPAVYHLNSGELTELPLDDPSETDIAWFTAPRGGVMLMASRYGAAHRLRRWTPGGRTEPLTAADTLDGTVTPIGLAPSGRWAGLHVRTGLRDRLVLLDTVSGTLTPLPGPAGLSVGPMAWTEEPGGDQALWVFATDAGLPGAALRYRGENWERVPDGTPAGLATTWAPSGVEDFPGAAGPIEAIVCGHEDWRTARQVVIALHGGPASRWSLKFSLLFQMLAAEGSTVIAPNPRGSTGYGSAFHEQIIGAWAGPDLEDVLAVTRFVREQRGGVPVALYGESYGAFVALLAASMDPESWAAVTAVAPMVSAADLRAVAAPEVRAMIDRLGGLRPVDDGRGPRDAAAHLPSLRAPLLLVHGENDPRIPVGQSRALVARLRALGRRAGADFEYVEVPGAGHTPLDGSEALHQAVARFLAGGGLPRVENLIERR